MIFLDTTYLLGIQLGDRMLLDVEERRQGILKIPATSSLRSTCWMI